MTTEQEIDERIYDLYDEYCHTEMDRRTFLQKASSITIAGVSGLAMAQSLLPRYAEAHEISFTDERINATYVDYDSPGGTSGEMRGVTRAMMTMAKYYRKASIKLSSNRIS